MKKLLGIITLAALLASPALADIYLFNTTGDQLTYEVTLPNGDTQKGVVKPTRGYGPEQTSFSNSAPKLHFKVFNEDGSLLAEETATDYRTFIIGDQTGTMKMERASWYQDNGQVHKRVMEFYNATDKPLTFNLIDEKEVRKDLTLQPGERHTYLAKNGFGGSSGFHHLVFSDGQRVENQAQSGYFVVLHYDKRDPGKIVVTPSGWVTAPKGKAD